MYNGTKTVLRSDIVALLVFLLVSSCQSQARDCELHA